MCGIAGYVGAVPPDLLPAMVRVLKHRGPDDEGVHVEPGLGLGMSRLAIIDLTTGRQPMAAADDSTWIVFNGEIYNHRELRARLEALGHRFRTRSDTEVIIEAYRNYGDACVEKLRGMFAFALWDRVRRRLLLARDHMGKKPLFYWHRGDVLLFASEIKALLCHPAIARELDWPAFRHYLAFGYTPRERSIFTDIVKLPPGHRAVFNEGRLSLGRYWALPDGGVSRIPRHDVPALVRNELREAVRLRLESDVPLGVFLSGGIDSSAIVASMREVTGQRISTFSVGFGQAASSFNELPYARLVARRFETDHHEEILEPSVEDLLPRIVDHFDEPFADSSAVPTYIVAQATAQHVKVALSGVGGDEAFAGYPRHLGLRLSGLYDRLPVGLRAVGVAVGQHLTRESEASRAWVSWGRRFLSAGLEPPAGRYLAWTRFFSDGDLARLTTPAFRAHWQGAVDADQREAFARFGHGDPVDGAFRVDLATYLPDDLLAMADRMGMAHSLEVRAPLCDHRLVELALRIPPAAKLPRWRLKGLLKAAFADVLPPEILARPKHGFMIPLARWLRTELRPAVHDLLAPKVVSTRGLFEPAAVEALKREHLTRERNHADRLWTLMMAELWMRHYLDGATAWTARG